VHTLAITLFVVVVALGLCGSIWLFLTEWLESPDDTYAPPHITHGNSLAFSYSLQDHLTYEDQEAVALAKKAWELLEQREQRDFRVHEQRDDQTHRARIILWVRVALTFCAGPFLLYIVLSKNADASTKNFAFTTIGTILGYWLSATSK